MKTGFGEGQQKQCPSSDDQDMYELSTARRAAVDNRVKEIEWDSQELVHGNQASPPCSNLRLLPFTPVALFLYK
jgi:hypothetical protein